MGWYESNITSKHIHGNHFVSIPWWVQTQQAAIWVIPHSKYFHYNDVIMAAIASQITSLTIAYSTVYSDVDERKHQSSASLAFVWGIHRWPVNSPHKWPVTRKMFPFDDVIMSCNWNKDCILKIWFGLQGAVSIRKTVLPGMAIPMLKIRRPNGRLIFNMEIAIRR